MGDQFRAEARRTFKREDEIWDAAEAAVATALEEMDNIPGLPARPDYLHHGVAENGSRLKRATVNELREAFIENSLKPDHVIANFKKSLSDPSRGDIEVMVHAVFRSHSKAGSPLYVEVKADRPVLADGIARRVQEVLNAQQVYKRGTKTAKVFLSEAKAQTPGLVVGIISGVIVAVVVAVILASVFGLGT